MLRGRKSYFITLSAVLLTIAFVFAGCARIPSSINGSGVIINGNVPIGDFNSVNIQGAFVVTIKQGETQKVILSTDDNLYGRVHFTLDHQTLKVNIEAPASFFPTSLKLAITMPGINELTLSGGAMATFEDFKQSQPFSLYLSGKSALDGSLEAGDISFHLSDASTVVLSGKAPELDLVSLDGSKLDLGNFALVKAQIKLDDASEAIVNVTGQFDVILNHKSKVYFMGNPVFTNISVSGGSTMTMAQK